MAVNVATLNPNLKFMNTVDGLEISWDDISNLTSFKRYLLLRKRYDYPLTTEDGDIVYEGTDTKVKDTTAENGLSYYYVLYVVVDRTIGSEAFEDYLTSIFFKKVVIVHRLDESARKMYNGLPQLYRTRDILAKEDYKQLQDLPLYRYLCLIGYQFDKIENLIDLVLDNIDIDTCDDKFLPYIARWLGVEYDWSISVTDNRVLIKMMIENYSRKGTYGGLQTLIQSISKSKVEIVVNKEKTPVDASQTAVNQRRTIQVEIYLEADSDSWVGTKQEKVLKVVSQNVPKKNAYTVRVVVLIDFWDTYTKNPKDPNSHDAVKWNSGNENNFKKPNDNILLAGNSIKIKTNDSDVYSEVNDDTETLIIVGYSTLLDKYDKVNRLNDNADVTSILDKYFYDDATMEIDEEVFDLISDDANTDVYAKQSTIDPDVSGIRGFSIRSQNLRGRVGNIVDMIYKNGELIEVRSYS